MKGTLKSSYIKSNPENGTAKRIYVYIVDGTDEQINDFKAKRVAANSKVVLCDKTQKPLMFETRFVGNTAPIVLTAKEEYRLDSTSFDIIASSVPALELAKMIANKEI